MGAVAYLHANDVIHTDLKPQNAVVDTEDHLVVIDLGSCVVDRLSPTDICGFLGSRNCR